MNRETAEHVAELAAILAFQPYKPEPFKLSDGTLHQPGSMNRCPAHVAAHEALALADISRRAHRFAERQCSEDISEARTERAHARLRAQADAILSRFNLASGFQWDPRGWPLAVHATKADATDWEYNGSPRELLRVTPHA